MNQWRVLKASRANVARNPDFTATPDLCFTFQILSMLVRPMWDVWNMQHLGANRDFNFAWYDTMTCILYVDVWQTRRRRYSRLFEYIQESIRYTSYNKARSIDDMYEVCMCKNILWRVNILLISTSRTDAFRIWYAYCEGHFPIYMIWLFDFHATTCAMKN